MAKTPLMRDGSPLWLPLVAAAIGVAGVTPFVATDGALVFDPDLRVDDILVYHAFFKSWSLDVLTQPSPNVYFEGHSFIYGLFLHLLQAVTSLFGPPAPLREAALATASLVGALAHIGATVVFAATAKVLVRSTPVSVLLTLFFGLSPQILNIDLIRIDRLMILPLMVVLHVSVLITARQARARHGVMLGIAMAVLISTKISSVAFGVFPFLALALVLIKEKAAAWKDIRALVGAALAAGMPVLFIVMIRHVVHAGTFIDSIIEGYAMQMKWTSVLPSTPLLYYNVDLFSGYGAVFLGLVALSVVVTAVRAIAERDTTSQWLLICLVLFSLVGMGVFKYDRGGYHLVPLYLFALAIGVRYAMNVAGGRARHRRVFGELAAAAAVLLLPMAALAGTYRTQSTVAALRGESVQITRMDSRAWIAATFAPGARICMMKDSQWANPPLAGRGFQVTTAPLDIPYLDGAAMATYGPPHLYQLRAACDAVVLNDLHNTVYIDNFGTRGYPEQRAAWEAFLTELAAAYPPRVFQGPATAYFVSRVDVYDLRGALKDTQVPSRAEALAGSFDGATLTFPSHQTPVVAGRFTGAIDAARQSENGVAVEGWAVDTVRGEPATAVLMVADNRIIGFAGTGTVRRKDVADALGAADYQLAGFALCGPTPAGTLRVFAIGRDGAAGELQIGDTAPGSATQPYPCQSQEGS